MVEFSNIENYVSMAAVHEGNGKPYLAVRSLSDAFERIDDLVEPALFALCATDIWNAAHRIGERSTLSASVGRSVTELKSKVEAEAAKRNSQIAFNAN
jgi:hypothetical protein